MQNVTLGVINHIVLELSDCSGMEEMDATVNSDDEADFTKMDMVCYIFFLSTFPLSLSLSLSQGNRKGPVKRWDFDTDEDYGNYQSSREALPKYTVYCTLYCSIHCF